jgi:hypothetical protein
LAERKTVTEGSGSKRIDEELVCADSLAHCLKERCGSRVVSVKREEHDPPDFWFTIDGEEYAVEVRSIVTEQDYHERCKRLAQTICDSSRARGSLTGTYVLLIRRHPELPKATSADWRSLITQATLFIDATQCADGTDEVHLLEDDEGSLAIHKISGQGATLRTRRLDTPRWEGEIEDELRELIATAVDKKRRKLERKGVPARCPRIMLLLYDAFNYGDVEAAQKALLAVDGYDWYHSVFWAGSFTDRPNELCADQPGREGTFLYSANGKWWGHHAP